MKTLSLLSLFFIIFSCHNTQETNSSVVKEVPLTNKITEKELASIDYIEYELDSKTKIALQDWEAYDQLKKFILDIKKGDFTFINNNEKAVKLALKEFNRDIPDSLKSASIEARILVVETKLYKLESLYNLSTTSREELLSTTKDFLVAFSNLNLQMNKKMEFDSRIIEKP